MTSLLEHLEGKYEVLGQLDQDGAGEIYQVRHLFLDEVRLVRVIRPPDAQSAEASSGHLKEARAAMRLRHPNIAQLHDFSLDGDGNAFIILEATDGLPLDAALRELGTPPGGLALEIAQQALRGLGYLHRGGMVHRDVAPERLVLGRDIDGGPLVKWAGLGISRLLAVEQDEIPMAGLFPARPRYAAPEQFGAGGREADARSDIYSLGLVLYELLTGRFPISGHDPFSYMAGHLSMPPLDFAESDPQGRVPADLREALLQMLAKDPAQRAASAEDVARRFATRQERSPESGGYLDRALALAQERAPAVRPYVPPPKPAPAPAPTLAPTPPPPEPVVAAPVPVPVAAPVISPPAPKPQPEPEPPRKRKDREKARETVAPVVAPLPAAPPPVEPPASIDEMPLRVQPAREIEWDRPTADFAPPQRMRPDPPVPVPVPAPQPRPAAPPPPKPAPVTSPPAPPPSAAEASDGSRTRGLLIVALLGVALVGGAIGWFLSRGNSEAPTQQVAAATSEPAPSAAETAPPPQPQVVEVEPQPVPPPPPANEKAEPSTEELQRQLDRLREENEQRRRRDVIPSPRPSSGPMQRGDLITPGPNTPNVEYPEPVTEVSAAYPQRALASRRKTRVRVAVLVDENGNVIQARVRDGDSSGLGFNEAAEEAARRTRYLPATRDGIPGKFWTDLLLEFEPPPVPAAPAPAPTQQAPAPAPTQPQATPGPALTTDPPVEAQPASPPPP